MTEAWLRGPLAELSPTLAPLYAAYVQASEDIPVAMQGITVPQLWLRPGGAASLGFHLRHIAGSLDRLTTYARGEGLTAEQVSAARRESEPGDPVPGVEEMLAVALAGVASAMEYLRTVPDEVLYEPRAVGRARLPATVFGLLFHCAEHTQRHTGQIISTAKIVRGLESGA